MLATLVPKQYPSVMSEISSQAELTIVEQSIMRTALRPPYVQDSMRVCLSQILKAETSSEETEAKRIALEESLHWDYEDYDEETQGARPEGTDPKADVRVCGIGSCTLRLFQAPNGRDIQTGDCKAQDYCLNAKFQAVAVARTTDEGRAQYKDIIDTCDGFTSAYNAGNFCPRLDCELSAGVSIDGNPGTAGECAAAKSPNHVQLPIDTAV